MRAVEDYEALARDPDVDIVYVSNIHPAHKDTSILMMSHGKRVLCEKPLAVSLPLRSRLGLSLLCALGCHAVELNLHGNMQHATCNMQHATCNTQFAFAVQQHDACSFNMS